MANYLDSLTTFESRAQAAISEQAVLLRAAYTAGTNTQPYVNNINWWSFLIQAAADTSQDSDLRLGLLTLVVNNAELNNIPTPATYAFSQPLTTEVIATVPFDQITGPILSNASAAAEFGLVLYKSGGTMTGPLLIDPTTRIDSTGTLAIGTSTATTVTIGRVTQNVAIPGTITLATWGGLAIPINKGGTGVTAVGSALQVLRTNAGATGTEWATITPGTGDVVGPGSATDNAIARFDSTTGKLIQNSVVTIGDTGNIAGLATISSGLWNGTVIGRPYGGFGNAMSNAPGDNFVYGYDVGDDESQFWTIGSRLTYGTQELNVNPVLTLTSVAASTFLSAGTYLQAGVASSATGQLRLAHASTANLTTITAGNAASALTFVWPVVNPSVGQVLTASAPSGSTVTLSWSTITALVNPMTTLGDLIYGAAAGAPTRLAGDTSNTRKFLRELSVASVATAPVWDTLLAADIPTIAQSQVSGLTTALANKLGTGLTDGYFFVGNAANAAVEVLMSQDGTLDNTGALTIADAAVTFAKMQNITYQTLMGRWSAGDGPPQEIAIGSGLTLSGAGVLSASGGGTGDVVGPASATDNAVARFDTGTGKLIQNSAVLIADTTGVISGTQGVTLSGTTSGTLALVATAISGTNTITFPAATGTVALTSALAGYIPNSGASSITGVALTGSLDILGDAGAAYGILTIGAGDAQLGFLNASGTAQVGFSSSAELVIQSSNPAFIGAAYLADYSANYTNRSLVDKEYVDGLVGGGTVTNTGTLTANSVVLGNGTVDVKVVAGIITDGTSKLTLGVAGTSVGSVGFKNATSGTITLQPVTGALGTVTVSLPATTTTLAGLAVTQTFTLGNTFSLSGATGSAITISGAGSTTNAGLIFSGSTNQWINMGSNGVGAPTFTNRSVGTKLVLFPLVGASTLDYAMGINTNILWFSVPDSARSFQWFSTITTPIMTLTGFGNVTIGQRVGTSLALVGFTYTGAVNTGQTASTEIPTALWTCAGRQWATGNFTTQREFHITTPTYTAVGASVIDDAYTFYVGAGPTASTNMTVTRAWSGGFNGLVAINTGLYLGGLTTAPTAFLHIAAGTTAKAQIRFVNGAAPSAPNDGDLWFDGTDLFLRVSGVTKTFTLV